MSVPTSAIASIQHATSDLKRPYANFPPGIWGDFFLKYASSESTEDNESVKHQIRILKVDVKKMLQSPNNHQNIAQKLNLIDAVQRLGVSYHLKGEIDEELEQIRNSFTEDYAIKEDGDLQSLALIFRLLRQQGYHISQDIFNKFKNNNGTFEEKLLANDVQGLLKLYEATQFRVRGEDILDEAHDFAYSHLKSFSNTLSPSLAAQINHYLKLPFYKREPRSEAKYYMAIYEEDPSHNESLLTFAKLDFNNRQKMHQKEMSNINKWYKKLDAVTKVPYARDRVVAGYFWGLAMSDEPEYSIARKMTTKMLIICSLLDDTFGDWQCAELKTALKNIFNKFKNNNGTFEEELLANDVQGLLKLYEATQFRVLGEDILDEAHDFAYSHLMSLSNTLSPSLAAQINHYLKLPFNRREPRSEAKYYMAIYEEDPSHNESLLTFAKLDFNIRQKMHQKEVSNINEWYKKLDYVTKVPYARDRVVAGYIWVLAMSDEPEYSIARKMTSKMVVMCTLLDDTFDAYGTLEELELFTKAFQRWDKSPCESLPECMKVVFDGFVQVCNEMEMLMAEEGKPNMIQYLKQAVYDLAESYLVEAKWCQKGYTPKYDEYKNNGGVTSVYPLIMVTFISMGKFASKKVLDWISSKPNIIRLASLVGRLLDDMGSHKFERERGHVASAVECCMNEYGISLEDAYKVTRADVTKYWKDINEECLKLTDIPKHVLDCGINLARITEFMYEDNGDKYTNEELLKDHVVSLLVEPISIKK